MKKIYALILIIAMIVSLGACAGKSGKVNDSNSTNSSDNKSSEKGNNVTADKENTVDITLPGSFFEDMTEEEIKASAEKQGFIKCVVNSDGSVTCTMTKDKQKELLDDSIKELDKTIEDLVSGEDKVAAFKSISYNENLSRVDIRVDTSQYSPWDSIYSITFFISGAYYQMFSGVSSDDIDIVVNFIDDSTNRTIESNSYKDWMSSPDDGEGAESDANVVNEELLTAKDIAVIL